MRTPADVLPVSDVPRRSDVSSSCDNAMLPTTMSGSNSVAKDNLTVTVEMGGVYTGDETELARMGYKQELKYVQFTQAPSSFDIYDTYLLPGVI
jgi:hypothetical protein